MVVGNKYWLTKKHTSLVSMQKSPFMKKIYTCSDAIIWRGIQRKFFQLYFPPAVENKCNISCHTKISSSWIFLMSKLTKLQDWSDVTQERFWKETVTCNPCFVHPLHRIEINQKFDSRENVSLFFRMLRVHETSHETRNVWELMKCLMKHKTSENSWNFSWNSKRLKTHETSRETQNIWELIMKRLMKLVTSENSWNVSWNSKRLRTRETSHETQNIWELIMKLLMKLVTSENSWNVSWNSKHLRTHYETSH